MPQIRSPSPRRQPPPPSRRNVSQVLMIGVGGEIFALDADCVREIIDPVPTTKVAGARAYLPSLINVRGNVIPLADMRVRFGMPRLDAPATRGSSSSKSRSTAIRSPSACRRQGLRGRRNLARPDPADAAPRDALAARVHPLHHQVEGRVRHRPRSRTNSELTLGAPAQEDWGLIHALHHQGQIDLGLRPDSDALRAGGGLLDREPLAAPTTACRASRPSPSPRSSASGSWRRWRRRLPHIPASDGGPHRRRTAQAAERLPRQGRANSRRS